MPDTWSRQLGNGLAMGLLEMHGANLILLAMKWFFLKFSRHGLMHSTQKPWRIGLFWLSSCWQASLRWQVSGPDTPGSLMNKCKTIKVILKKINVAVFPTTRSLIITMQMRAIETINTKTGERDPRWEGEVAEMGREGWGETVANNRPQRGYFVVRKCSSQPDSLSGVLTLPVFRRGRRQLLNRKCTLIQSGEGQKWVRLWILYTRAYLYSRHTD